MESSQDKLLNVDQVPSGGIAGSSTSEENPSLYQWSGRFWQPANDRVEPTRKFCLVQSDGRAGDMILGRFASRSSAAE
jgi:hypothetical protein